MIWINFFHIYQPPDWEEATIRKVTRECYGPLLDILKRNPSVKITLNISASLTEQLAKYGYLGIIEDLIKLAKNGQIEFTHSAKYHLILPLFSAEIIYRQIRLNEEANRRYLGSAYKPRGFYVPEMAWGNNLVPVLEKLKIKWVILDEISYNKKIGRVNCQQGYQIKNTSIKVIFRNRTISNFFAFEALFEKPDEFCHKIKEDGRCKDFLITGMDGENLGHHRKNTEKLWENLITRSEVTTDTCSALLKNYDKFEAVDLAPASWSSEEEDFSEKTPYILWQNPKNPIHVRQWALVEKILGLMEKAKNNKDENLSYAQELLDKSLASDQFWWASMRPWWSQEIIIREAEELVRVLEPLKSISIAEVNETQKMLEELAGLVREWQASGQAKAKAEEYMHKVGFVPEMGGKKITE
ncbi:MAG: hypothetical protein WC528_03275 [Patescibacteria group bacterium]